MEQSELKEILDQHQLWVETNGMQGQYANLTGADLRHVNLYYANLTGADLTGADLWCANLSDANLHCANLTGANLRRANLTGADLKDANLKDANLVGADLRSANLTGANLTGANITGADLGGANLTNAILPDISWIIPGCLVQLNKNMYGFYLKKEDKYENFVQDSLGFFIQNNPIEKTFDMLLGDRIIRGIPDWVKLSGLKKLDP